jgi:glucokinase
MHEWVIGIDLGGTKIDIGLVNPHDQITACRRIPTDGENGPQAVVERIARSVAELEKALPEGQQISALGICSPGPVDHQTGLLLDPPNLQGLHHTPLRQMLADRLHIPISLEHDAKAAALGDFYYGAGRDARSMVYVVVGTGVGAAIIVDGQVYRGEHNFAGEIGHSTMDRHGELCSCGSRGCVETYMSGPWLARRYQDALDRGGWTAPREDSQPITGEVVARMAKEGDPLALKILVEAGEALGITIATMAMILNIDLYVIGGSVAKAGDLFLDPARKMVPHYSFQSVSPQVRIVATELDTDGPILGCAWLARQAAGQ